MTKKDGYCWCGYDDNDVEKFDIQPNVTVERVPALVGYEAEDKRLRTSASA